MKEAYIVWVEATSGGVHREHESLEAAKQEAARLAIMSDIRGKRVCVAKIIARCKYSEVTWEEDFELHVSDDQMPDEVIRIENGKHLPPHI